MIYYKIDICEALRVAGYTLTKLKRDKIFGGALIDQLRAGKVLGLAGIDRLCSLLDCQPGDIIGYKPDPKN